MVEIMGTGPLQFKMGKVAGANAAGDNLTFKRLCFCCYFQSYEH